MVTWKILSNYKVNGLRFAVNCEARSLRRALRIRADVARHWFNRSIGENFMANKPLIIAALRKWIAQRPGLEFGNYGTVSSYRSEMRSITRDMHHARTMIDYVAWHDSITADMILDAAKSGRLAIKIDGDKVAIDYCTGQYWPTEYRAAVCRLMAGVIWSWLRENTLGSTTGDHIRTQARLELGASIQRRWFE